MLTAKEEKELFNFVTNPAYRERAILKIHKEKDSRYNSNIKAIQAEVNKLITARANEITRISNARWEHIVNEKFSINRTEGKVKINQIDVLFSSIKGAEINFQQGCSIITTNNSKSKRNASVVGGALFGDIGAAAGGVGLGKTTSTGRSVSNQIPTCTHLGVLVNVDGFVSEIVLLGNQVDQSNPAFTKAYNLAQQIVLKLGALTKTPVPDSYLMPEQEVSVKNIEAQIAAKQAQLQATIANRPTYELPPMYRTEEQKDMTDEEYLSYLKENDALRQAEIAQNKALEKQQRAQLKELSRKEKVERRATKKTTVVHRIFTILSDIVFWHGSVFMLLMSVGFITSGGVASGIIFLLTSALINPLIYKLIKNKLIPIKRWMCIIVLFVGFIAGIIALPSDNTDSNNINSQTVSETQAVTDSTDITNQYT